VLIINTGGTFNKVYEPISGELIVPRNNIAVESILRELPNISSDIEGIIFKDSLDMDDRDREELYRVVRDSRDEKIVIIHGTDTMDISAKYIAQRINSKKVVFTGAMIPFSISPIEATANLSMAISSLRYLDYGVYISMQGVVLPFDKIKKDRRVGIFREID